MKREPILEGKIGMSKAQIGSGKKLLQALRGQSHAAPPIWLMRQAGRYLPEYREIRSRAGSFLELCYDPERATEITLQPVRRFGMDAAILFSDILVVPDAMGQSVAFREGEGPVLEPVGDRASIVALDPAMVVDRLAPVYETARRVRGALPGTTALIGFSGAPWTVATYMIEGGSSKDFATAKRLAYGDPELFGELIDRLVEATVGHLRAQVEAGADAVQIFDTWAGVLPDDQFARWCIEPVARIVAALRTDWPDLPVIGFPRGVGLSYARFARETGVTALSVDQSVPPEWAAAELQPSVVLQGNLDPILLATGGTAMRDAVERILDALSGGPFIFNLGHGVIPSTPVEHVEALVRQIRAREE